MLYISGGDPGGLFIIDINSGDVTTPLPLDYDTMQQSFQLTIQAEDGGSPPLSSTVIMVVEVEPVNEDVPNVYGSLDATVSEEDGHGNLCENCITIFFNFSDVGHKLLHSYVIVG